MSTIRTSSGCRFSARRRVCGEDNEDIKSGVEFGHDELPNFEDGLHLLVGRRLFEKETFGGNGRTCLTCHSRETGTVSPEDARQRFERDQNDLLFQGDGSDDGEGNGAVRMLIHATVRVNVPMASNIKLASDANARTALVTRGIPTTLNSPALDPVLMYDGRHQTLDAQAQSAILDHAAARRKPAVKELERIAEFERSRQFFTSTDLWNLAVSGKPPRLPTGRTESEKRGRSSSKMFRSAKATSSEGPALFAIAVRC